MVKKENSATNVTIDLDKKLNRAIEKYCKENNVIKQDVIVNTLKEKFHENVLIDPVSRDFFLIHEQLLSEWNILESRRIMLVNNRTFLNDNSEKIMDIRVEQAKIKNKLQTITERYNEIKKKGEIVGTGLYLD